jgi:hypothetical protein
MATYRGLTVISPIQNGGIIIEDNFKEMADRAGPVFSAASNPTVNDDESNTSGNAFFYKWSKWHNSSTDNIFICVDSTTGAANWQQIGDFSGDYTVIQINANPIASGYAAALGQSGTIFTNEGSAAKQQVDLPGAVAGSTFTFMIQSANGIRVVPNSGDFIRIGGSQTTSGALGGYIESTTVGSVITIVAINSSQWFTMNEVGNWLVNEP